jgi:hypothetical protein
LFIDIEGNIYYSDIVSTFNGELYKDQLLLGNTSNFSLSSITPQQLESMDNIVKEAEKKMLLQYK